MKIVKVNWNSFNEKSFFIWKTTMNLQFDWMKKNFIDKVSWSVQVSFEFGNSFDPMDYLERSNLTSDLHELETLQLYHGREVTIEADNERKNVVESFNSYIRLEHPRMDIELGPKFEKLIIEKSKKQNNLIENDHENWIEFSKLT